MGFGCEAAAGRRPALRSLRPNYQNEATGQAHSAVNRVNESPAGTDTLWHLARKQNDGVAAQENRLGSRLGQKIFLPAFFRLYRNVRLQ